MTFNKLQFIALIKLGKAMQAADGRLDEEELNVMSAVVISFGVSPADYAEMLVLSDEIDATTALGIIAGMNASQKRYVCAFLATIMVADGDIDPKEHALWNLTSALCDLPTMTINEALEYMKNEFGG